MSTGEHEHDSSAGHRRRRRRGRGRAAPSAKLDLDVQITDVGPCKKHLKVAIAAGRDRPPVRRVARRP